MTFLWRSSAYSHPWLCRFTQSIIEALNIRGIPENQFFNWSPFRWRADIDLWVSIVLVSYWVTSPIQIPLLFFLGLGFIEVFICAADLLVENCLDELKRFPLALNRMSLNSATAVFVHIILNSSNVVIGSTSIIEGITSQCIVRRVILKSRGLLSMRSRFCAVLFPKDVPASFGIFLIPKCCVWTWRLTKFPFCFRSDTLCQCKLSTSFRAMGTFYQLAFSPLLNPIVGGVMVQ